MKESSKQAASPAALLRKLHMRGEIKLATLAMTNADLLATAEQISALLSIPVPQIRRWEKTGKAIAYRMRSSKAVLFPIMQFEHGGIRPWAADIIAALGNSGAAFHFLLVPRASLGRVSLARKALIFSGPVATLISATLARRTAG